MKTLKKNKGLTVKDGKLINKVEIEEELTSEETINWILSMLNELREVDINIMRLQERQKELKETFQAYKDGFMEAQKLAPIEYLISVGLRPDKPMSSPEQFKEAVESMREKQESVKWKQ